MDCKLDREKLKEKAKEKARENFRSGCNCAEAVFKAISELIDEDPPFEVKLDPSAVRLATGFGGGIGEFGDVCGGVTGGTMALGIIYGFSDPFEVSFEDRIGKEGVYKLFNQLPNRFEEKFGTIECSEIIKKFDRLYSKEHLRYCMGIASKAAEIVAEIIMDEREKGIENLKFLKSITDTHRRAR